ncbi:hypothetical protein [Pontibacter liquoris]|uniref:hypothetical protein n=1 Tax=Pontibacter liquoris TaxID=2905677 RepID=UPI001FA7B43E|nr:hypothetical protein [Pontibacter liquoris]
MKVSFYLLILWGLLLPAAHSQGLSFSFSHSLPSSSPTAISQDRNGHVYLLDARNNLLRLDSLGRPLDTFSPPTRGRISSIDAWNPLKLLLFYQDRQQLLLLDRFLRPISSITLADLNYPGTAKAAALAADDAFWLFDETTLTLSKLDMRLGKTTIETPLNLILDKERFDVRQLREYQNMVYLLDYNGGIFVFDNLGNYKKKLPYKGVSYIGFRNNELYFVQNGALHFLDLYTSEERTLALPAQKPYLAALLSGKQVFLFTSKAADIYTVD